MGTLQDRSNWQLVAIEWATGKEWANEITALVSLEDMSGMQNAINIICRNVHNATALVRDGRTRFLEICQQAQKIAKRIAENAQNLAIPVMAM